MNSTPLGSSLRPIHGGRFSLRAFSRICIGLAALAAAAPLASAATINGSTPYLNGANLPWNQFGIDFGTHPTWGAGYNGTWFNNAFAAMKAQGINSTRIWVHCDGRASPEFNSSGDVTGLDSNFIPNLQDMLDKANANGIKIQLCLWSFDMLNNNTSGAGPYAGNHANLITNTSYRSNYITKALNPMLDGIVGKPALAVIEVINEPEWGIAETPATTTQSVTKAQMQAFVSAIAAAVNAKTSTKNVTVGSGSIKWSTANGLDATVGDWWAGLGLDHRDVHYYDWMTGSGYNYDPFKAGHTPSYYGWSTPAVIGEFGGNGNSPYGSVSAMMEAAWTNGYAGHMPWSYVGVDGEGAFNDFKAASLSFANNHLGSGTVVYSFESSTQSWGVKFGSGTVATSTTQHQGSGSRSLRVNFSSSPDTGIGVDAPTNSPAGKTLTFWVWVPNQTALNGIFAFVQYGSGWTWTQGATKTNGSLTKNAWNSVTVTAPAGQTIQRIGVGFDWVSTYTGTFYIDSVTY
jgi:hypothetical protein